MPLGGADLFFDQIEVIKQPFPGWGDPPVGRHRFHQQAANVDQGAFIGSEPNQQLIPRLTRGQDMRSGQLLAVLFHLDGAEQFRPQRLLVPDVFFGQAVAQDSHPQIFNFGAGQPFPGPEARRFRS